MKDRLWLVVPLVMGVLLIGKALAPRQQESVWDLKAFGQLPVQFNGRVKPLDTVARNSLLLLRGKQTLRTEGGQRLSASAWLLRLTMNRSEADQDPVFRIDHGGLLSFLGWRQEGRYFSFSALKPHLGKIAEAAGQVPSEAAQRSLFERALLQLRDRLAHYQHLAYSLHPQGAFQADSLPELNPTASLGIVPGKAEEAVWQTWGQSLEASLAGGGGMDPVVLGYLQLATAYLEDDASAFNAKLQDLTKRLSTHTALYRLRGEYTFRQVEPFYQASLLYVLAFLVTAFGWLLRSPAAQRGAHGLLLLTFALHTVGLLARMYLQGRPPVTNLYSSAVFVGWGAVLFSLVLERFYRRGLGNATGSLIGFATLIVAHHLQESGETLEVMRAVLDSNFWLATHVVTITLGYSAAFLAGTLGAGSLLHGVFARKKNQELSGALQSMVYGVLCFAIFFSFLGTMLGGIWADQSWGRFWGWDPKENGALLIVLGCALTLHARRGRIVGERGFMALAVFGNIITAWSWFGTNMLGVGLHAYGFIDQAFVALMVFVVSQLAIIALGLGFSKREP